MPLSFTAALTLFTMGSSSPPAETSLSLGVSPALVVPLRHLAISCLMSDTKEPEFSIISTVIPPTSPFTTDAPLLMDATNTASSGLTGAQGVCCPLQATVGKQVTYVEIAVIYPPTKIETASSIRETSEGNIGLSMRGINSCCVLVCCKALSAATCSDSFSTMARVRTGFGFLEKFVLIIQGPGKVLESVYL